MKITYLGTAAAEAIPAVFCQCEACEDARKNLGKQYRCRAAALIDDDLLIDFPPDIFCSTIRAGVYLPGIKNLVFTHSHKDHCSPDELANRATPVTAKRKEGCEAPLQVYGNQTVLEKLGNVSNMETRGIVLNYIEPFKPVKLGEHTVTALPADHKKDEAAYFYLIEKDGKRFIYGHDTGFFPDESMEYLKGIRCDAVSLDCCHVLLTSEHGHMGIEANRVMRDRLIAQGTADEKTKFIANHFSHNGFMAGGRRRTLEEFEAVAASYGFDVSYDTMTFEI